ERDGGAVGHGEVADLGDPLDAVAEDPLDASLQGLGRRRAADARAGELDGDDSGGLVDVVQHDVALVGLDGRSDHLDDLLDLLAHWCSWTSTDGSDPSSMPPAGPIRPLRARTLIRRAAPRPPP